MKQLGAKKVKNTALWMGSETLSSAGRGRGSFDINASGVLRLYRQAWIV